MHTGTAVLKHAGCDIPDAYLSKVLENQTSIGVAQQVEGKLLVSRRKKTLSMADMATIGQALHDKECLFFFQTGPDPTFEDDVGPFEILSDSDGKPCLIAFLDGNFSQFEQQESSHSPQFFAVQEEILPRIKKLYNLHNGDVKKLMADISEDRHFAKDLINTLVGDRGSIILWASDCDPITFRVPVDESFTEFDWGTVTNNLGYSDTPASVADDMLAELSGGSKSTASAAPKASERLPQRPQTSRPTGTTTVVPNATSGARTTQKAPDVAPAAQPGPGSAPNAAPAGTPSSAPVVNPPVADPNEMLTLPIPPHMDGKKLVGWIRKRVPGRELPNDWKQLKAIICKRAHATSAFLNDYNKTLGLKAVAAAATVSPKATSTALPTRPASVPSVSQPKIEQAKPVDKPVVKMPVRPGVGATTIAVTETVPEKVAEPAKVEQGYPERSLKKDTSTHVVANKSQGMIEGPIAIIPPGGKQKILGIIESTAFKEAVDRQGQLSLDPAKFQRLEDKIPKFHEQVGLERIEDTVNWPYAELLKIAKTDPDSIAVFANTWRSEAMEYKQMADELLAESSKTGSGALSGASTNTQPNIEQKATGTTGKRMPQRPGRQAL